VAIQRPRTIRPGIPHKAPATPYRKGGRIAHASRMTVSLDLPRHVVARNDSLGGRIASASRITHPTGLPRQFSTRPSSQGQCWGIRPKYRDEPPRPPLHTLCHPPCFCVVLARKALSLTWQSSETITPRPSRPFFTLSLRGAQRRGNPAIAQGNSRIRPFFTLSP
jgi:hypothetical protein